MASTDEQQVNEEDKLILSLRRERGWGVPYLYLFQEFWCPSALIHEGSIFQNYFQARDRDVVVASFPKTAKILLCLVQGILIPVYKDQEEKSKNIKGQTTNKINISLRELTLISSTCS
ncbi:Cytosolic sulfotransferase 15 [Spatholobus suberectus]|nr:Cytosolic sulfotransferase 15 [Spatholobus suberectus]